MVVQVAHWTVFDAILESGTPYENPLQDVTVQVVFTAPSGEQHAVDAFWDGATVWRVRFCPGEEGRWHWQSACSDEADIGLHKKEGAFECVPYDGENPLYRHGPLKLSRDRRYLVCGDGTPFFWLSDTAWNGALRAHATDWARYLQMRYRQGYSAVQFVSTHWCGSPTDPFGETAYNGDENIHINPVFFQWLDDKVRAVNRHGLVAAPVLLWAFAEDDPGRALSEANAIRLARYIVARWGAYHVVWFLGGDGDYRSEAAGRWQRIGQAVFGDRHDRLVTMHPSGQTWVRAEFDNQDWFDFIGYQSGHGSADEHLNWLTNGPPATDWPQEEPVRPVINLEPNYENHPSYHEPMRFSDHEVRRTAYWSALIAPTAGVSYGHYDVWAWLEEAAPVPCYKIGEVPPWHQGLETPGVASMSVLRQFFESLPWWRLRPAPSLLAVQPGETDPRQFIAAARTADNRWAVLYTPLGGEVVVQTNILKLPLAARWVNPRNGESFRAGVIDQPEHHFLTPDSQDWLLVMSRK
jgi:hypothetical protein